MPSDTHDELVEAAKQAINKVFGDTTVSPTTTKQSLEELRDEIETLIDTI